jgi:hypothetical protein
MVDKSLQTEVAKPRGRPASKLRVILILADGAASVLWLYVVLHIFVLDVDALIKTNFPVLSPVIDYKGILLAGLIALVFALTRNVWSLSIAAYIALYPLILFFWKLPRLLWRTKSPIITLAFLNVVFSFFRSIRYNLASAGLLVFLSGVCLVSTNKYFVIVAIIGLLLTLLLIYTNRLRIALRPSVLYDLHSRAIGFFSRSFQKTYKPAEELQPFEWTRVPTKEKSEILVHLQFLMILARGASFLSEKLRQFHHSNVRVIFYLVNFLILILTTVYIFAIANYALWRVSPDNFQLSDSRFFTFIYYGFAGVFGRGITEILPTGDLARILVILQIVFSFFVLAIVLTLVFSLQSKRDEEGIESAIRTIREEGQSVDAFINSEYRMTGDQIIQELEKTQASLIRIIYYFTND